MQSIPSNLLGNTSLFVRSRSVFVFLLLMICVTLQAGETEQNKAAREGEIRRCQLPDNQSITCIASFDDGRKVVAGTTAGAVWIWDVEKDKAPKKLQIGTDDLLSGGVMCLAVSPDSVNILVGCADASIHLLEAGTGKEILVLKGQTRPVHSVAFFKNGRRALSGGSGRDSTARLWDLKTGKEQKRFDAGDNERLESIAIAPDQKTFATTDFKTVQVWDTESGKLVQSLNGHELRVYTVGFSPGGRTIISGDYKGIIRLWDVEKGKCVRTIGDGKFWAERFGFSPDGKLALLGAVKEMLMLDIETGSILKEWTGMDGAVQVAFSPDGKRIVSGDESGLIRVWDVHKLLRNVTVAKDGKND